MTLTWRFAAHSDVGLLRDGNEDSAYAGNRLLAVADGMGGHAAGEVASAAAIAALEPLDHGTDETAAEALRTAVRSANASLRDMVAADAELQGMGTTVTAVYADDGGSWLAHIGDSRAYLLHDGELRQLTRDHTFVQQLVDEGRIQADEASSHPQRALLTRALDGREPVDLDLLELDFQPGDRLLLCTDGLSGVVSDASIREVLATEPDPEHAARRLVELALRGGGPDNVTCIVADPHQAPAGDPVLAGAVQLAPEPDHVHGDPDTPAARAAALETPEDDPRTRARRIRRRHLVVIVVVALAALTAGATAGWAWVRAQYYVGVDGNQVVVYRGVEGSVAGVDLSSVADRPGLPLADLPAYEQAQVRDGIHATSRSHAEQIVERLRQQAGSP